ncbi:MAG: hypothetical protein IJL51_06515 [Oscillospiraceae bacterium]|nr:hypothetical protein [Oscillospiraceae bacterium]
MGNLLKSLLVSIGRGLHRIFSLRLSLRVLVILLAIGIGGTWMLTTSNMKRDAGGEADYDEALRYIEIKDMIEDHYIDEVDRARLGESAAAAMVSSLGDRWSSFMTADEYKTFQLSSSNEVTGAGISTIKQGDAGFQVTMVNIDSPAARGGLNAGMLITAIDDIDVRKLDADEFRTMIRSRLNAEFTLSVSGQKDPITVDCTRTYVSPVSYKIERTGAGNIKIDSFEAGSAEAMVKAFEDLLHQNVNKFVIDLRDNPGGLISELQSALDYLLPQGELFVLRDKAGNEEVFKSDNSSLKTDICILINGQTYGEAEIFAAVMQEAGWATVIGERTSGRTRLQQTIEVSDGSAIRLSTRSFMTPNRVDIAQNLGVVPDIIVYNVVSDLDEINEGNGMAVYASDPQLRTALERLSTGFSS